MPPKLSQKSGKGSQKKGEKSKSFMDQEDHESGKGSQKKGEKSKTFMDQEDPEYIPDPGRGQGQIRMVMTQTSTQETLLMRKKKT